MINICIDPGHGDLDGNGVYTTAPSKMHTFPNGFVAYEGTYNRILAKHVGECLSAHKNINVIYTVNPEDPRDLSLPYRVRVVNSFPPNRTIFISIHNNAGGGTGFEIFTTRGFTKSDKLAEEIANAVEHLYENRKLNLRYDFSDGDKDKEVDFYVLRKANCPCVLIEGAFFDSEKDIKYLEDPIFMADLGSFIYTGILNFVANNYEIEL